MLVLYIVATAGLSAGWSKNMPELYKNCMYSMFAMEKFLTGLQGDF